MNNISIVSNCDRDKISKSNDATYYIVKNRTIKKIEVNGKPKQAFNEMRNFLYLRNDDADLQVQLIER